MTNVGGQLIQVKGSQGQMLWIQFGVSEKQKTPQAILTFRRDDTKGLIQWTGYLKTDKIDNGGKTGYERVMEAFHLLGFTGDDLDALNDQAPAGRASLAIEVDTYDGREKVRFVNTEAFTIGAENALAGKDLKALSAKLKASKSQGASSSGWNPNGPGGFDKAAPGNKVPF